VNSWWPEGLTSFLVRHPARAITLSRAAWMLRRDGWWRAVPFLPLPDAKYWHFRMVTANGDSPEGLTLEAMVSAAEWSLRQRTGK